MVFVFTLQNLDPLTDAFGSNEGRINKIIRLILLSLALLVLVIIITTSTRPVAYFQIFRSSTRTSELPFSSIVLLLFDIGLCFITTALHIYGKIFQISQDSKQRREILELEIHLNRNLAKNNSNIDIPLEQPPFQDVDTDGYMVHKQTFGVVVFTTSSMMIIIILLLNFFHSELDIEIDFWWTLISFLGNQGLFIPMSIIIWNPTIKTYFNRKMT